LKKDGFTGPRFNAYNVYYSGPYQTGALLLHLVHLCFGLLEQSCPSEGSSEKTLVPVGTGQFYGVLGAEFLVVIVLWLDAGFLAYIKGHFQRNPFRPPTSMLVVDACVRFIFFIDCCYAAARGPGNAVRFSRVFRVLPIVFRFRRLRTSAFLLIKVIPDLTDILVLLGSFVVCMSCIAVILFKDLYDWTTDGFGFWNFLHAAVSLGVLLTAENYPGIIFSANSSSAFYTIFFLIFIFISLFFFVPGLIAQFFESYKKLRKGQLVDIRIRQLTNLVAAFRILDAEHNGELTKEQFNEFVEEVYSRVLRRSKIEFQHFLRTEFEKIDKDGSGTIDQEEFCTLAERIIISRRDKALRRPDETNKYRSFILRALFHPVDTPLGWQEKRWFSSAITVTVCLHLFLNSLYGWVYMDAFRWEGNSWARFPMASNVDTVDNFNLCFCLIYMTEISAKFFSLGISYWRRRVFDRFDVLISLLVFPSLLLFAGSHNNPKVLTAARMMFVLTTTRIFTVVAPTRHLVLVFVSLVPVFFHIAILCLFFLYGFATIGQLAFCSFKRPSDEAVANNPNAWNDQLSNNVVGFSDLRASMLTMIQFFIGQNFTEVMLPFALQFGMSANLYFFVLLFMANLLLSNLLVGMIVDAFIFRANESRADEQMRELWTRNFQHSDGCGPDAHRHCWLCVKPLEGALRPFEDCACAFHRKCIIGHVAGTGKMNCPKCTAIALFGTKSRPRRRQTDRDSLDLEQQMFGAQVAALVELPELIRRKDKVLRKTYGAAIYDMARFMTERHFTTPITVMREDQQRRWIFYAEGRCSLKFLQGIFRVERFVQMAIVPAPTHLQDWKLDADPELFAETTTLLDIKPEQSTVALRNRALHFLLTKRVTDSVSGLDGRLDVAIC